MNLPRIEWRHMGRTFRNQAFLLLMALALGTTLYGQTAASISGTITDVTGGALAGANVKVKDLETDALRTTTADESGRYVVASLDVGIYELRAEKTGFKAEVRRGITLAIGQHAEVNLTLQLGQAQETVVVVEDSPVVSVTTQDISGLVGERQVKDLPLNGRSYDQLLTLNPGIVNYTSQRAGGQGTNNSVVGNMFAVSGRKPQENLYILNGVEFTGASEVNNTPGGASGQLLGVDAVREFEVVKDTYGAEYGKRPGAQVNIVTASGTNQLHGNAYEFLRNNYLDARNFFDQGKVPQFQRNVFGGSVGGPLKKDKSFVFGNYEGFRQVLGISDVTLVPDDDARAGKITPLGSGCPPAQQAACSAEVTSLLTLWPVANGPEVLTSTGGPSGIAKEFSHPLQHIREDFGTLRFDQIFSEKDSFAAVYTADDSTANTPTANPLSLVKLALREQVASLSETHIFSPSLSNKAAFGFSRGSFYYTGQSLVALPGFVQGKPVGALTIGGSTAANANSQISPAGTNATSNLRAVRNLFTWTDQATFNRGKHMLRAGVWFQRIQANDDLAQNQYGLVTFADLQSFLRGTVKAFTTIPSSSLLGWRSLEGAWYAEDAVKLTSRLEVRIGFRDEFTNGWNEVNGRAANYLFADGVIATTPTVRNSALTVNNAKFLPSPRVGIAWSPFASGKTVIHAGYGLYYALLDNLSYRLDNLAPYNASLIIQNVPITSISGSNAIVPGAPLPAGAKVPPSGVQPDIQTPVVNSWSLKIEQQLSPTTAVSVGYIGSHGYHGILTADYNLPVPAICPASPCPANYPVGTWYNPPKARLANPEVGASTTWASGGVSSYNGVVVDLNRRLSHGLAFRGAYTFSKALDDGDTLATTVATNSPAYISNPMQPKWDYGRSSFDIRHAGVINATYDLPFGRPGATGGSSWVNRVIGDWQISAIVTLLSGVPFTPQLAYNPSNDGDTRNPVRPSWNPNFKGQFIVGDPNHYFNTDAFVAPLAGTWGNVGRNVLEGPGLATTDVSLAKKFALKERFNLQFRAEIFNVLNHTNLNTPNPVLFTAGSTDPAKPVATSVSSTAGVIISTATTSRQIQFGLKLLW